MLKKFVFRKISTIEIPKSSKLHRYVNKVRKLYRARYICNNKSDPKIINLIKWLYPRKLTSVCCLSLRIKRDFLTHKAVKTNDKIRRFGVVITPLSRKIWIRSCKLQHLKAILARRINIRGCEDYKNTFARIESDCTLRFGFKALTLSSQICFCIS